MRSAKSQLVSGINWCQTLPRQRQQQAFTSHGRSAAGAERYAGIYLERESIGERGVKSGNAIWLLYVPPKLRITGAACVRAHVKDSRPTCPDTSARCAPFSRRLLSSDCLSIARAVLAPGFCGRAFARGSGAAFCRAVDSCQSSIDGCMQVSLRRFR